MLLFGKKITVRVWLLFYLAIFGWLGVIIWVYNVWPGMDTWTQGGNLLVDCFFLLVEIILIVLCGVLIPREEKEDEEINHS